MHLKLINYCFILYNLCDSGHKLFLLKMELFFGSGFFFKLYIGKKKVRLHDNHHKCKKKKRTLISIHYFRVRKDL